MFSKFINSPKALLRAGLGLTYIYSGFGLVRTPEDWLHFMPNWFGEMLGSLELSVRILQIQGIGEILLGVLILIWYPRAKIFFWLVLLGALHVAIILVSSGIDLVTFRDIGLLGAWLALLAIVRNEAKTEQAL